METFSNCALRDRFQFYSSLLIHLIEYPSVTAFGKGADDFAYPTGLDERSESCFMVSGIIVHNREIAGTLVNQGVNQFGWHAGPPKAADEYGCTIMHSFDRFLKSVYEFIDHFI